VIDNAVRRIEPIRGCGKSECVIDDAKGWDEKDRECRAKPSQSEMPPQVLRKANGIL
jgi:hypothetical protein